MVQVVVDTKRLKRRISKMKQSFNPRVLMQVIGMRQLSWINANFETDGKGVGGWEPLSPNTIAARRHGGSKPLQDTGALKRSFHILELSEGKVVVGSLIRYAAAHNEGVPASRINPILPKRKKALSFVTANGRVIVKGVYHHPGIPKRRILPTQIEAKNLAVQVLDALIKNLSKDKGQ